MTLSLFDIQEPAPKAAPAPPITGDALLAGLYRSTSDDCRYRVVFKDGILWQSRCCDRRPFGPSEADYGTPYTVTAAEVKRLLAFKIFLPE